MRISVTRTGGFAGLTRRGELETTGRADAPRLDSLARDAVADRTRTSGAPDGFRYEITVGDRTVRVDDPHLSEAQRALVRAVLDS
ncbi:protealysin inhibitor emfourin [Streptomyces sp. ICBB 8177]|uniref:protealysin inhibitor emfourin n=1 Tax=Streptomyces sp. ICBB 8177 TaxID=563922 RepID=UPI000D68277C|nr:protealysin inhibitor emfourin [Streptomyces sp. ICBB 8177]PWI43101.1 hypothetical protein CK485_12920 [Streptomyces sp. ICBB 8177]